MTKNPEQNGNATGLTVMILYQMSPDFLSRLMEKGKGFLRDLA